MVPPLPKRKQAPSKRGNAGPTRETVKRKAESLGLTYKEGKRGALIVSGDVNVSNSVLDRLLAERLVTEVQHKAGAMYGRNHRLIYGQAVAKVAEYQAKIHERIEADPDLPPPKLEDEREYFLEIVSDEMREANRALGGWSLEPARHALRNICVYDSFPRQLERQLEAVRMLTQALDVLIDTWRLKK